VAEGVIAICTMALSTLHFIGIKGHNRKKYTDCQQQPPAKLMIQTDCLPTPVNDMEGGKILAIKNKGPDMLLSYTDHINNNNNNNILTANGPSPGGSGYNTCI
jgi:hypothetical protein